MTEHRNCTEKQINNKYDKNIKKKMYKNVITWLTLVQKSPVSVSFMQDWQIKVINKFIAQSYNGIIQWIEIVYAIQILKS